MLKNFFAHYLELPAKNKNVICLGGGSGTAQILKGLRDYHVNLTAVVSMADDGGSAGRLRRAFSVPPPGDLVNCLAALSEDESSLKDLLLFRFAGDRYGKDTDLGGQKLGNLIFVALTDINKGDTSKALEEFSKIISSKGRVIPATIGDVNIWATTPSGKKVTGEEDIDLGRYGGENTLSRVYLQPENVKAYTPSIEAIEQADLIVVGPGDLFSTILPVLIVPQIQKALAKSKVKKVFIVNIANKPFETAGFSLPNYLETLENHLHEDIFDTILVNNNHKLKIPDNLNYRFVAIDEKNLSKYKDKILQGDFVDKKFPIYHDSSKVAATIQKLI